MTLVLTFIDEGRAIDCFSCMSVNNSLEACEDTFGPTGSVIPLLSRDCLVGYPRFKATHCVKITGTNEDGHSMILRTCVKDNWGNGCGDIPFLDQKDPELKHYVHGCVTSCNTDGCNTADSLQRRTWIFWLAMVLGTLMTNIG
ncbi:unnamed protein product [Owenia fusiformis]|uniref:Protein sleepless n=1 Tax=Owenia fusiformis TaxID=6347 RepID=A0A8S4PLX9_OWEFU|nr:unnamed protein product [Owenia fusiformis]